MLGFSACNEKGIVDGMVRNEKLSMTRVMGAWWPLAASWALMSAELPAISAIIARLEDPEIHLAAYGSVVFPIALVIEAPIIMLLTASTALSRDLTSYLKLHRYMMFAGGALTALHIGVAFTPLYDLLVRELLNIPEQVVEPSRIGLMIMTPWTWSIAHRRFNQGVLIRFGHSKAVSVGTTVRLTADLVVLALGFFTAAVSGIVVGTLAVTVGVVAEAIFIRQRVGPVIEREVQSADPVGEPLTLAAFLRFYTPLAATSLLTLSIQPIASASMSRMPRALDSLAAWPVVYGFLFLLRGMGHAYQDVVVALLDEPSSEKVLRSFALRLAGSTTVALIILATTPLSEIWFETVSGLDSSLGVFAQLGLSFGLVLPGLSVLQNWHQGTLVNRHRTRGISESVVIFVVVCSSVLFVGVKALDVSGLFVGLTAFSLGGIAQTTWIWRKVRQG